MPDLDELVATVQSRCPDGSDLDRLGQAVEMSAELGVLSDRLLDHFVAAAREADCSWAEIGTRLGVTKQAAQQRFVATWAPFELDRRSQMERFTRRARRAIFAANRQARRLGHGYIGTEHLLLGAIHDADGLAARALEGLGVDLDDVRAKVEDLAAPGAAPVRGRAPFTPRAKKALELALREALALGHSYIGTEHLLLGVLAEGEGLGARALSGLGVEVVPVREKIVELLSSSVAPEPRLRHGRPADLGFGPYRGPRPRRRRHRPEEGRRPD